MRKYGWLLATVTGAFALWVMHKFSVSENQWPELRLDRLRLRDLHDINVPPGEYNILDFISRHLKKDRATQLGALGNLIVTGPSGLDAENARVVFDWDHKHPGFIDAVRASLLGELTSSHEFVALCEIIIEQIEEGTRK